MLGKAVASAAENDLAKRPPLKVGSVVLDNRVVLAPMSGVTDAVMRRIAARCGAGRCASVL